MSNQTAVEGHAPGCDSPKARSLVLEEKHLTICLSCCRVLHACEDPADHKPRQVYRCTHSRCHWTVEVICADVRKYSHTEGPPYCPCGAAMELAK